MKYSAVQCSAVQCSEVQCSVVQCSAVQCCDLGDMTTDNSAVQLCWEYFLAGSDQSPVRPGVGGRLSQTGS